MKARVGIYLGQITGLAALYTAGALLGLMVDAVGGFAALVWPPTGLAIAAFLLLGERMWPGVWLGAFAANIWTGAPVPVALGIAVGNTLEALVAVLLLRALVTFRPSLDRVSSVLAFVVLGAGLSTLVSATFGVVSLALGGVLPIDLVGPTFRAWWLGDALGALVFAPFFLTMKGLAPVMAGSPRRRVVEALLLGVCLFVASLFVFGPWLSEASALRQAYVLFPFLVWAALRFGQPGAARATLLVSILAVVGTMDGVGPFVRASRYESLLYLQAFMAFAAVTFMVFGALTHERALAEEERERTLSREQAARSAAENAVRTRDEFLAVVSHDLKNPLASVLLNADRLLLRSTDEQRIRGVAKSIRTAATRMDRLIHDLLDWASIEAGRLSIVSRPHEAVSLVRETIEMLSPSALEKQVALTFEGPDAAAVFCDRERVFQVLTNIVGNAIKFTPESGRVTVAIRQHSQEVTFSIKDTGPGIDAEELPRLFERFWHGRRSVAGAGLGLFIARGIVEAHGGRIWVESHVGEGSTFLFTLSARGPDASSPSPPSGREPKVAANPGRTVTPLA